MTAVCVASLFLMHRAAASDFNTRKRRVLAHRQAAATTVVLCFTANPKPYFFFFHRTPTCRAEPSYQPAACWSADSPPSALPPLIPAAPPAHERGFGEAGRVSFSMLPDKCAIKCTVRQRQAWLPPSPPSCIPQEAASTLPQWCTSSLIASNNAALSRPMVSALRRVETRSSTCSMSHTVRLAAAAA